jgi:hypothetical protein
MAVTNKFIPNTKDVNYLAKNFTEFRQNLIDFTKSYYPGTYADFNESSPGMVFMEMAAYVGDVLSFYIDNQFKENLLLFANERKNVISIAQSLGYKPRLAAAATVEAVLYQAVPALGSVENYDPDQRFFLRVNANSRFSTSVAPIRTFRSTEDVDFADPTNRSIRVLARSPASNVPTMYLVSKPVRLIAAELKTATFTFGSPQKFSKIELPDSNVLAIDSVEDSDGNTWYEVDYLGQDVVVEERDYGSRNAQGRLASGSIPITDSPPTKIAQFKRKPRRFATRVNENLRMELWFGSGNNTVNEEIVTLNSTQIANSKYNQRVANVAIDPSDFLSTDTFGLAPANTTIIVNYLVGGGIQSNAPSNTITVVESANVANRIVDYSPAEQNLYRQVVDSIAIENPQPATGGSDVESIEEIRQNALAFFNAQNRVVTDNDYIVRTMTMPPKFGAVAKVAVIRDEQINSVIAQDATKLVVNNDENPFNNKTYVINPVAPNSINLYVLGYNSQKKLTTLNSLVKQNLANYLEQYRMLTDEVNIADAFVVNIGVEFSIVVERTANMNDVLARSIDAVNQFFNVDRWQINQPIVLNDLELTIGAVDGVKTVLDVKVVNKYKFRDGDGYEDYKYPIDEALVDGVIYPSLDPCIFEIRYPETDIVGNARQ